MVTLVTGVSGFVGARVARALAARGEAVRGIARASSARTLLADFPGELVEGDLLDPAAVARAMAGVDRLYHVAAEYRLWAPDPEALIGPNRAMTLAVMEAALDAGVRRIVYTSSVATMKPDPAGPSDETRPASSDSAVGAYKRSKVIAERLVEELVAQRGLPAVIVNPAAPIGPGDAKPTPTGRIVVDAASGRMPAYIDTGLNLVHVDDVAAGHLLAMDKGRIGERYVLGGEDVPLGTMLAEIARAVGRKPPRVRLPRAPLYPLAVGAEAWARVTGREPMLTVDALRMAKVSMFYSSAKAARELGYTARPWQAAIADAVAWFRQAGMIG